MSFRLDLDHIDRRRLVPGLILIGIGVLGLLSTFGWLRGLGGLVGGALFGAAAYFAYLQGRHNGALGWRVAVFPLAGLALASIAPEPLGGFAFLGSIGAAFTVVYRDDPQRWWAVIPAGALYALALTALVDGAGRGPGAGGSVFLFGLAATFFVLTRLPRHAQPWAVYPAAALALLAVVTLTTTGGWIVPLALIAVGAWMLLRPESVGALLRRGGAVTTEPSRPAPTVAASATVPVAPAAPAAPAAAAPTAPSAPAASAAQDTSPASEAEEPEVEDPQDRDATEPR